MSSRSAGSAAPVTRSRRSRLQALRDRMGDLRHGRGVDELAESVVDGTSDPYAAAEKVLDALT